MATLECGTRTPAVEARAVPAVAWTRETIAEELAGATPVVTFAQRRLTTARPSRPRSLRPRRPDPTPSKVSDRLSVASRVWRMRASAHPEQAGAQGRSSRRATFPAVFGCLARRRRRWADRGFRLPGLPPGVQIAAEREQVLPHLAEVSGVESIARRAGRRCGNGARCSDAARAVVAHDVHVVARHEERLTGAGPHHRGRVDDPVVLPGRRSGRQRPGRQPRPVRGAEVGPRSPEAAPSWGTNGPPAHAR